MAQEAERFWDWFVGQEATPTIVALRERAEAIRRREVEKAGLADLSPQARESVEALTRAITNKLLHPPLAYLKRQRGGADTGVRQTSAPGLVRQIFGLDENPDP